MVRYVVVVGWLVAASAAYGQATFLSGPALKQLMTGAILYINTPLNTKLPVRYGENGQLSGVAGTLASFLGAKKDTGRWWVARNRLCHRWTRWFDGETQCLKLRKSGERIYWLSDEGKTGTAFIRRVKPRKQTLQIATLQGATPALVQQVFAPPKQPTKKKATRVVVPSVAATQAPQANPSPRVLQVSKKGLRSSPQVRTLNLDHTVAVKQKRITRFIRRSSQESLPSLPRQPSFRVAGVAALDELNVRTGPSEYHRIVGRISPSGRGVKIVGSCRAYWCPIRHRKISGWVNRYYLAAER